MAESARRPSRTAPDMSRQSSIRTRLFDSNYDFCRWLIDYEMWLEDNQGVAAHIGLAAIRACPSKLVGSVNSRQQSDDGLCIESLAACHP
jgi:hypothetical protein